MYEIPFLQLRTSSHERCLWHPYGWDHLLGKMAAELQETDPDYAIADTKEKFGQLRVATEHHLSPEGQRIVWHYETVSVHVCQECGRPGRTIDKHATQCEEHANTNQRGYGPRWPSTWTFMRVWRN